MLVLSAVWTLLLINELTFGLSQAMQLLNDVIWVACIAQFALEFLIAPQKGIYLRKRWLTEPSVPCVNSLLMECLRLKDPAAQSADEDGSPGRPMIGNRFDVRALNIPSKNLPSPVSTRWHGSYRGDMLSVG